jgi:hypothetical protein
MRHEKQPLGRRRTKPSKGHKSSVRDGAGSYLSLSVVKREAVDAASGEVEEVPSQYLDTLSYRELGAATREFIIKTLRPIVENEDSHLEEANVMRRILEQLERVSRQQRLRGGLKWTEDRAVQLVAAVLRRTHQGQSVEKACAELASGYVLPTTQRSTHADLADVVVTTFKPTSKGPRTARRDEAVRSAALGGARAPGPRA